jgi:hypothetical protein
METLREAGFLQASLKTLDHLIIRRHASLKSTDSVPKNSFIKTRNE